MRATARFSLSFAVSLTTLLAACGGGGGGSSSGGPTNPADPSGVYFGSGQFADAAGNDNLMLVESDNSFWIFYIPPATPDAVTFIDTGNASIVTAQTFNEGSVTDYAMLYDDPNSKDALVPTGGSTSVTTGLTVSMDYTYLKQIDGSILDSKGNITSSVVPLFISGSKSSASLATVAGNYTGNFASTLNSSTLQGQNCFFGTAFTVGSNGKINGTLDDCTGTLPNESTVSGTLTPRTDIAAFDITLAFTADGSNGQPLDGLTFTGVAYYLASSKTFYIAGLTADGKNSLGFAGTPQ